MLAYCGADVPIGVGADVSISRILYAKKMIVVE